MVSHAKRLPVTLALNVTSHVELMMTGATKEKLPDGAMIFKKRLGHTAGTLLKKYFCVEAGGAGAGRLTLTA